MDGWMDGGWVDRLKDRELEAQAQFDQCHCPDILHYSIDRIRGSLFCGVGVDVGIAGVACGPI